MKEEISKKNKIFISAITAAAGFPSPAENYIEEYLDIGKYLVNNIESTFFVRISGDSMINVGIYNNDIMVVDKSLKYVERVYSSNIKAYPLLGTKPIPKNEWTKKVVLNKKNFLGKDMKTIKKLFFDHEVISSLGCGSIINIPVINNNIILGTMNILHKEFYYNSDTVKLAKPFASLLSGYFLFHQQNMKTK